MTTNACLQLRESAPHMQSSGHTGTVNDEVEMMHAQIGNIPAHEVNDVKQMISGQ